jgi:Fe-S cluster assembly ATP-binding protein
MNTLSIKNLKVDVEDKKILNGINLEIKKGETHAIMGPNGSGKSTLAFSLMGHPKYKIIEGEVLFNGKNLLELSVHERAQAGVFLAFQYPHEIEGLSLRDFLWQSYSALHAGTEKQLSVQEFQKHLQEKMELLKIKPEFVDSHLNVGFSGGEKKRAEVLQLAVLEPKVVVLDEIDSGLDIDSLKIVCDGINIVKKNNPDIIFIIITHYPRILNYLIPDVVHVMQKGVIVKSGDIQLANELEKEGYDK